MRTVTYNVRRTKVSQRGPRYAHLMKHIYYASFVLSYIFQLSRFFKYEKMTEPETPSYDMLLDVVGNTESLLESTTESDFALKLDMSAAVASRSVRETADSCRAFTFREISVSNSCNERDVSRASIESQIEMIRSNISSLGNREVLIMLNAVCLGLSNHSPRDITITNQYSVEKLERFLVQTQRWNGPVSSALYIRDMEDLVTFQSFLLKNLKSLRRVSFHVYFDYSRSHPTYPYPNNILRNIALDNISTDYFLLMDIDLFTAPAKTHDSILSLLTDDVTLVNKLNEKTIFVLPAFENLEIIPDNKLTADYWSFPQNKSHVKNMYENGTMPQFKHFNGNGQSSSNYAKWMSDETDVSYPISFKFGYEPYVIGAKKSIPRFYDFFRGYGLNKLSWFTELHLAGYKYEVLRDHFVFHANHVSSYEDKEKHSQLKQNTLCSKGFIDRLLDLYGDAADDIMYEWKHEYNDRLRESAFGRFRYFYEYFFGCFGIIKWRLPWR